MIIIALCGLAGTGAAQHDNGKPYARKHEQKQARHEKQEVSPDERAVREAARMAEKLSLNDEQKEKWRAASLERHQANAPLKEKMRGSTTPDERKEVREKLRQNNQAFDKRVEEFLTAEQKRKLEEQRSARRERVKEKRHGERH